jgi:hypothetical protein
MGFSTSPIEKIEEKWPIGQYVPSIYKSKLAATQRATGDVSKAKATLGVYHLLSRLTRESWRSG